MNHIYKMVSKGWPLEMAFILYIGGREHCPWKGISGGVCFSAGAERPVWPPMDCVLA
jgi:hypothetical protein